MKKDTFEKTEDISAVRTDEFSLPLVNAKHGDNGIMYYGRPRDFESAGMCLDVVGDGAIAAGDVYPQPQKTGVLYNAYLIKFIFSETNINEYILIYFACSLQKSIKFRYGYDNKAGWEKIKNDFISLPVTESGGIDFEHMETYIQKIEEECFAQLDSFVEMNNLKNCGLTASEEKALSDFDSGKIMFRKFRIGDLFDVWSPKKKFNANEIDFGGKYPYIARGSENNGIRGYTNQDCKFLTEGNTISFGQDTATIYYQANPYFTGDKIKIMKLRDAELNENLANFFITSMRRAFSKFGWGVSSFNKHILNNVEIFLPMNSCSQIDYGFMENYISAQKKLAMKSVAFRG